MALLKYLTDENIEERNIRFNKRRKNMQIDALFKQKRIERDR